MSTHASRMRNRGKTARRQAAKQATAERRLREQTFDITTEEFQAVYRTTQTTALSLHLEPDEYASMTFNQLPLGSRERYIMGQVADSMWNSYIDSIEADDMERENA